MPNADDPQHAMDSHMLSNKDLSGAHPYSDPNGNITTSLEGVDVVFDRQGIK